MVASASEASGALGPGRRQAVRRGRTRPEHNRSPGGRRRSSGAGLQGSPRRPRVAPGRTGRVGHDGREPARVGGALHRPFRGRRARQGGTGQPGGGRRRRLGLRDRARGDERALRGCRRSALGPAYRPLVETPGAGARCGGSARDGGAVGPGAAGRLPRNGRRDGGRTVRAGRGCGHRRGRRARPTGRRGAADRDRRDHHGAGVSDGADGTGRPGTGAADPALELRGRRGLHDARGRGQPRAGGRHRDPDPGGSPWKRWTRPGPATCSAAASSRAGCSPAPGPRWRTCSATPTRWPG